LEARANTPSSNYKFFCQILDNHRLLAEFSVLETEASFITKGRKVVVKSFAFPDVQFRGKIDEIQPMVDENGMIKVRALVDNSQSKLLDGMNVQVIVQASLPNQLVVPKTAVVNRQGRQIVFTVVNNTAIWNYVQVGKENSTQCTITEGLQAGQSIITGNNLTVGHNATVRIAK
jgi:RND family efflux transporter MFP subunit